MRFSGPGNHKNILILTTALLHLEIPVVQPYMEWFDWQYGYFLHNVTVYYGAVNKLNMLASQKKE